MNEKFDELARGLAQSVSRRTALKKFGVSLAASIMAVIGLANKAQANERNCLPPGTSCRHNAGGGNKCCSGICTSDGESNTKYGYCL